MTWMWLGRARLGLGLGSCRRCLAACSAGSLPRRRGHLRPLRGGPQSRVGRAMEWDVGWNPDRA
eukprot:1131608-Alexandrium_andersonii.AAC.1